MAFDWAAQRERTRRVVHTTFGVPALYSDVTTAQPVALTVRLHDAVGAISIPESQPIADILEHITQIVFDAAELVTAGVTPRRGAVVRFPVYDASYVLDADEPHTGPIDRVWTVVPQ